MASLQEGYAFRNRRDAMTAEKTERQRTRKVVAVQWQVFGWLGLVCLCVHRVCAVFQGLVQLYGYG